MLDAIIVIAQYARDQLAMGSARDQAAKVSLRRPCGWLDHYHGEHTPGICPAHTRQHTPGVFEER